MNLRLVGDPAAPDAGDPARRLCFNWASFEALRGRGLEAGAWEDELPPEAAARARRLSLELADSWMLDGQGDLTAFEGVSLGRAQRWLLWTFALQPAFKFAAALEAAVRRHRPASIACDAAVPEIYRRVLAAAAPPLGVEVEWLAAARPGSRSASWAQQAVRLSLAGRLALGALNGLRKLSPFFRRRKNGDNSKPPPRVVACYYHTLEPLLSTAGFRWAFADTPRRRRLLGLALDGAEFLTGHRMAPAFTRAQRDALAGIRRRWSVLREAASYRAAFAWNGLPLWPALVPALDALFKDGLEDSAWTAASLLSSWETDPPALVLLPFDGPPLQSLLQQTARGRGIPSAMLLHGLPLDYSFPLEHAEASRLLVWGPEQEKLYRAAAPACPRKVVAAGNPYFDRYASPARSESGAIKEVLVLTHPASRYAPNSCELDPERYALAVVAAVAAAGDWQVTLKLHPSESLEHYQRLLSGQRVRVVRDEPIAERLASAGLVVGSFSTVLMEAMLLGKPVVCVNLTPDAYPPPFDEDWGLAPLRGAEELAARLQEARRDPVAFRALTRSPYERILAAFAGPRGTAAESVLKAILER